MLYAVTVKVVLEARDAAQAAQSCTMIAQNLGQYGGMPNQYGQMQSVQPVALVVAVNPA